MVKSICPFIWSDLLTVAMSDPVRNLGRLPVLKDMMLKVAKPKTI